MVGRIGRESTGTRQCDLLWTDRGDVAIVTNGWGHARPRGTTCLSTVAALVGDVVVVSSRRRGCLLCDCRTTSCTRLLLLPEQEQHQQEDEETKLAVP